MIRATTLVIAGLMTVGSAAWAAPRPYSATLATAVAKRTDVIAGTNLFRCEETTCNLVSKPIDAGSVSTCRRLARKVGEIKTYGSAESQFDAEKLARCNAK